MLKGNKLELFLFNFYITDPHHKHKVGKDNKIFNKVVKFHLGLMVQMVVLKDGKVNRLGDKNNLIKINLINLINLTNKINKEEEVSSYDNLKLYQL
jgi:hypothetical protein